MTFILNVLNKNFSLLVADKKARTDGPSTLTIGEVVVNVKGSMTLDCFQKMHLNSNASVAVGVAGNANDHAYLSAFEKTEEVSERLDPNPSIYTYVPRIDCGDCLGHPTVP